MICPNCWEEVNKEVVKGYSFGENEREVQYQCPYCQAWRTHSEWEETENPDFWEATMFNGD